MNDKQFRQKPFPESIANFLIDSRRYKSERMNAEELERNSEYNSDSKGLKIIYINDQAAIGSTILFELRGCMNKKSKWSKLKAR